MNPLIIDYLFPKLRHCKRRINSKCVILSPKTVTEVSIVLGILLQVMTHSLNSDANYCIYYHYVYQSSRPSWIRLYQK
jgi:hypothetical protein